MLFAAAAGLHRCDLGQPFSQWLVPGVALIAVVACVYPVRLRRGLAAALAFTTVSLTLHFAALVHEPGFIGRSDAPGYAPARVPGASAPVAEAAPRVRPAWHSHWTGIYRVGG